VAPRLDSFKARVLDMNVLMTVAVVGAALLGEWGEGATVYFLFALGGLLESRSLDRTRRSIRDLMSLAPPTARIKRDGLVTETLAAEVTLGETFVVRPGERIALDGVVTTGQALWTGCHHRRIPAEDTGTGSSRAPSTRVACSVEATVAIDSTLARILSSRKRRLRVHRHRPSSSGSHGGTRPQSSLAAAVALLPVCARGRAGSLLGRMVRRGLVLLVVSCPCALVISTPVAIVSGITRASRDGVLVSGRVSRTAATVDAVAFDKTGTLTRGRLEVQGGTFGSLAEPALEVAAAQRPLDASGTRAFVEAAVP
jgi:Cd2+/Zn2+-exporting ATPase